MTTIQNQTFEQERVLYGSRELLRLLSDHRRHLLDCLHREERRIDCLDYLVYQLEKRRAGEY